MHPTIIKINRTQFLANLAAIRRQIGKHCKLCLPVKANAYGHGIVAISHLAASHVDYLAVACLDEALILRKAGILTPILVLGAIDDLQIPSLIENNFEFTLSSAYKAQQVVNYCQVHGKQAYVHLKIDSGMNRIGVRPQTALDLIHKFAQTPELRLVGIYSHLHSSDEPAQPLNRHQIDEFSKIVALVKHNYPQVICHLANSGGICSFPDSYFDMVRPGIMSYGYLPNLVAADSPLAAIRPCLSLTSRISYFKVVAANQGISYNHRYTTTRPTRVITIPIGYGDGYRRGLSNLGEVIVRGHKYTISGNICMDMLMVDVGPEGEAYVGDEVVLIGQQGEHTISACDLAKKLNTIVYEILVGFNQRIPRHVVD